MEMAQQGHHYGLVEVSGHAQARLGDTITINHYHAVPEPHVDKYDLLLDSLTFDGMGTRVRNVLAAMPATCEWLPHHPSFLAWADDRNMHVHHGFLWLKGKPGSGKSTIMKETLNWVTRTWSDQTVLSHFFNARSSHLLDKSCLGLYRSLVWQILATVPVSRPMFVDHFASKVKKKMVGDKVILEVEEWTEIELQNYLAMFAQKSPRPPLTIFIDALDEGTEDDVRRMVRFLERLTRSTTTAVCPLRICLSSRHFPHISVLKSISIVLEDQVSHGQDIEMYIRSELIEDSALGMVELQQSIRERSAGVFLWVVLVIPVLNQAYDHGGNAATMSQKLNEIPADLRDLFTRILRQNTEDVGQCVNLLQWVLSTKRPLTLHELYCVVRQVTLAKNSKASDAVTCDEALRYLRSCSRGLVELSKAGDIQFIHETVRDYLMSWETVCEQRGLQAHALDISAQTFQADSCHEMLAEVCLLFLLRTRYDVYPVKSCVDIQSPLKYAAKYWWQHLLSITSPCGEKVIQLALALLTDSVKSLRSWVRLYDVCHPDSFFDPCLLLDDPDQPLYYAACIGRPELVSGVLALGVDINARTAIHDSTALIVVSERGHEKAVQILLDAGANVNAGDILGGTALIVASERGHEKVVQILLDAGANINAWDFVGNTALRAASRYGHEKVVQILLDSQADVNAPRGMHSKSTLMLASSHGHKKIVQMLIEHGATST